VQNWCSIPPCIFASYSIAETCKVVGIVTSFRLDRHKQEIFSLLQNVQTIYKTHSLQFIEHQDLQTVLFWAGMQCVVVIPYSCFGTTYWSHLQGSKLLEPLGCPETLIRNYHYTQCDSPEEHSLHLLMSEA
jgi:hypothetical protein